MPGLTVTSSVLVALWVDRVRLEGVRTLSTTVFEAADLVDRRPGVSTVPVSEMVSSFGIWIVCDLKEREGVEGIGVISVDTDFSGASSG